MMLTTSTVPELEVALDEREGATSGSTASTLSLPGRIGHGRNVDASASASSTTTPRRSPTPAWLRGLSTTG